MRITFRDKNVERLCTDYKYMNRQLPSTTANKLQILMTNLEFLNHISQLQLPIYKKYRYHELVGDKKGIKSLSIDYAYRLTLTIQLVGSDEECDEILILEVTKHYGD